jgi:predicted cupin superfamily sugar epimerase
LKTSKTEAQSLIERLDLKPLALEGGYFRETYRSDRKIGGCKDISTCIYFLLTAETFSAFHRLPADEIWHFYAGDPVNLHVINEEGQLKVNKLAAEIADDSAPQVVVYSGCWQAATLADGGRFALLGCTVAPAFDFEDYQHGKRDDLLKAFPQYRDEIMKLTRGE